jgi:hypothetical protein
MVVISSSGGMLLLLRIVEVGGGHDVDEGAVHFRKHVHSCGVLLGHGATIYHVQHLLLVMNIVTDGARCCTVVADDAVTSRLVVALIIGGAGSGGRGRCCPGGAGERVALRRPWVVVVGGVGDDEHGGVGAAALHLLPGGAALGAAAPVVPPRVRRSLDGLLPVLAPRPQVGRHNLAARARPPGRHSRRSRDAHHLFRLVLPEYIHRPSVVVYVNWYMLMQTELNNHTVISFPACTHIYRNRRRKDMLTTNLRLIAGP